jgi:hypothetical protein
MGQSWEFSKGNQPSFRRVSWHFLATCNFSGHTPKPIQLIRRMMKSKGGGELVDSSKNQFQQENCASRHDEKLPPQFGTFWG